MAKKRQNIISNEKAKENKESPISERNQKKMSSKEREEALIENFVGLQKAMTNLSIKFESLAGQIAKLLEIFEQAAKSFLTSKQESPEETKDMLNKINSLLEQNKTIARGLVLMEEKLRSKSESTVFSQPSQYTQARQVLNPSPLKTEQANNPQQIKKAKPLPQI